MITAEIKCPIYKEGIFHVEQNIYRYPCNTQEKNMSPNLHRQAQR